MTTDDRITDLLNRARADALDRLGEVPATRDNLIALGSCVRDAVLRQADQGFWQSWGVMDREELKPMKVKAEINKSMVGPSITLTYNFAGTRFAMLVTESVTV